MVARAAGSIEVTAGAPAFDHDVEERRLVALVEAVFAAPDRRDELVVALREDAPFYAEQSRVVTARMRGWVLAAFERVGLPDAAVPFVIEELESGHEPYVVAAAARAVRGRPPDRAFARYLAGAIENVRGKDTYQSFTAFGAYPKPGEGVTAAGEIIATLHRMGAAASDAREALEDIWGARSLAQRDQDALRACLDMLAAASAPADCCALPLHAESIDAAPNALVRDLELEDHHGARARFSEVFSARPTIVVFFYTRCDNPLKCSLTITKLGRLQRMLEEEGALDTIATAAITYDPGYDHAFRLGEYGRARRCIDHPNHRLLRAVERGDALVRHFQLGVGFIGTLVNRHRTECFVVDGEGRVRRSFARTRWDERAVIDAAKACLPGASSRERSWPRALLALVPSVLVAFFPKCALCWAAYLSMFGVASLSRIPYSPWLFAVFAAFLLANLASAFVRARRSRSFASFLLSLAGAAVLILAHAWPAAPRLPWLGIALVALGSLAGVRGGLRSQT